jgi:hypothetical protein
MFKQFVKSINATVEPRIIKINYLDRKIRVLHKRIVREHQEMIKELLPNQKKKNPMDMDKK